MRNRQDMGGFGATIARDRHGLPVAQRHPRKWDRIITAFMEGRTDELLSLQRGGARGRIFAFLVEQMLSRLGLDTKSEPVFDHVEPNPWYVAFCSTHSIKLRTHAFYNPDYALEDGSWIEVSLSENTAYQKVFRYGHQASRLMVIWLDEDTGLHSSLCENVVFPNAEVVSVEQFYPPLKHQPNGAELVERTELLKQLKGVLL